jgi:flagellar biogenesis protein FliO
VVKKGIRIAGLALTLGWVAFAQAPEPGPSMKELNAPLVMDDGKPTRDAPRSSEPSGWRALGSTILVLGLAGGGLWAFRKWGAKRVPGAGGRRLKVEETLALGDRRYVSILRADDERFLISLSPHGTTLLTRLGPPEEEEAFNEVLLSQQSMEAPVPVREMEARLRGERP